MFLIFTFLSHSWILKSCQHLMGKFATLFFDMPSGPTLECCGCSHCSVPLSLLSREFGAPSCPDTQRQVRETQALHHLQSSSKLERAGLVRKIPKPPFSRTPFKQGLPQLEVNALQRFPKGLCEPSAEPTTAEGVWQINR